MELKSKIREIVKYITSNFVAEIPRNLHDPEDFINRRDAASGKYIPITTTLLILNTCLGNNTLIEGGCGTSKTQLASVIGSIMYGVPYELYERRRVIGTEEASVNDMYATHDLAELNKGKDIAYLYLPFYLPLLVIDELNRFSPLGQNLIREGIASGNWNYGNHSWLIEGQIVVSAVNPESYGGTFELNENLVDNFSVTLEPAYYNAFAHNDIVVSAGKKIKNLLGNERGVNELSSYYAGNKNDFANITRNVDELRTATSSLFASRGVPILKAEEIKSVRDEISAVRFSAEASLYIFALLAEMTYSKKYGRLRFDDPQSDSSHDQDYLNSLLKETMAGRFLNDLFEISRAIAWYTGKKEAGCEDVRAAFCYTAARRIKPAVDFFQRVLNSQRKSPAGVKAAKMLAACAWKNYSGFANPGNNAFNQIRLAVEIMLGKAGGNINSACEILEKTEHPIAECFCEAAAISMYRNS